MTPSHAVPRDARLPRRVLMTADGIGGVWTYALDLGEALARRGIEVVLATMGAALLPEQVRAARALGLELHESELRLEWMHNAWDDVDRAGEWLLRLADDTRADAIHLNGYAHAALAFGRPVIVVAHSCVCSWWWAVHGCPAPAQWNEYRARVTAGIAAADRVVAPTHAMLRALETLYAPVPHGSVVFNGRAPRAAQPGPKAPYVLAAGRVWDEAKNLKVLERVAPRISWPIRVAGDIRHPDGRDRPLAHVQTLGRLAPAALAEQMRHAAIFVAPARYEPFGLGPVEAALAGCALVLADIPSLREVWREHAYFVAPDDDAGLARAIEGLARDPKQRDRVARAARRHALGLHPDAMAAGYLEIYRGALASHSAAHDLATTGAEAH